MTETDVEPIAQSQQVPDLDTVIAARVQMEDAFWNMLRMIHEHGGVSANEIARRVGAAGIASRPIVLSKLRVNVGTDMADGFERVAGGSRQAADALRNVASALHKMQESARD